jgi:glycosyltransferase involved in cell wall biosynthesis
MSLAVSVVVPFFNPGANIRDCLDSLLEQTLPRDEFEIVLVDDGSTDGTPQRVESVRAQHPELVRIERIPASGWAGAPRNHGVKCARGTFIQFVDADDALHPRALDRLLRIAVSSNADIVIGKLSSDFRTLNHPVYRHTVTGRTLHDFPLVESLTPHKMFRRSLLVDNDITFVEGPRHVEDEHFCMQAYAHAASVAVVGDLNCYYYQRRRSAGRNLGDTEAVPRDYYRDLEAILDVIDSKVADAGQRIPLHRRFYRVEMLGRLRGKQMLAYRDDYRSEMVREVRALAGSRFLPAVREGLPFFVRAQSRLMLDADVTALISYAEWLESIRLRATTTQPAWQDGRLEMEIEAALYAGDEVLRLERAGETWAVPASAAPGADLADRSITDDDLAGADIDCATVSRADASVWSTTEGLSLAVDAHGAVRIGGKVRLDPAKVMGGAALSAGLWDLRLRLMFGGLTRTSPLRPGPEVEPSQRVWLGPENGPAAVAAYWTEPTPAVALDVDEWSHPLHDVIDPEPDVELRGRRLRVSIPAITGVRGPRPAQVMLEPAEGIGPADVCAARLVMAAEGARLEARLPQPVGPDRRWRIWVRIGEAGGPAPRPLRLELWRQHRRYRITPIADG